MNTIKLRANAKINLTLGITGKREDGYHTIDTIMQSIDLCDDVTVTKENEISVICDLGGVPEKENIAYKAASAFFTKSGLSGGAEIKIEKHIPSAAGLGGGSSDAAAVLVALNEMYHHPIDKEALKEIALSLGADVPFFIEGGTVRATGIGEILQKCTDLSNCWFVLVKNGEKPSTAEMYKRLDRETLEIPDTDGAITAIEENNPVKLSKYVGNSFAAVVDYHEVEEQLKGTNPLCVSLSGSGPSVFAMYLHEEEAKKAFNQMIQKCKNTFLCKPIKSGIIIE